MGSLTLFLLLISFELGFNEDWGAKGWTRVGEEDMSLVAKQGGRVGLERETKKNMS